MMDDPQGTLERDDETGRMRRTDVLVLVWPESFHTPDREREAQLLWNRGSWIWPGEQHLIRKPSPYSVYNIMESDERTASLLRRFRNRSVDRHVA